jgi:hypothetical protein
VFDILNINKPSANKFTMLLNNDSDVQNILNRYFSSEILQFAAKISWIDSTSTSSIKFDELILQLDDGRA